MDKWNEFYLAHAEAVMPGGVMADSLVGILDGRIRVLQPFDAQDVPAGARVMDASGMLLSAGWLDLQFNGGFGCDFTDQPERLWEAAAGLPRYGVTGFLPTIITASLEVYERALGVLRSGPPAGWHGAIPLGYHFEGPFLNPAKKGAHNPAHMRLPSPEAVSGWSVENGVRLVTLAPELPGALDVIRILSERGVLVSAGHSLANYEQALAGFAAGVRCGTHLFNAMPPLGHRDPGLAGALLTRTGIAAGLIPDGMHVHPAMAALAWRCKGPQGLCLVTDAMAALGMPPGVYRLGDYEVTVDERTARLPDGTLAGSILTLDAALRGLVQYTGCTLVEALPTVTVTPARLLGLAHKGCLEIGADADLVLLTPQGEVVKTWVEGEMAYEK